MSARRFTVQYWTQSTASQVVGHDAEGRDITKDVRVSPTHFSVNLHNLSMDGVKEDVGTVSITLDTVDDLTGENFELIRDILIERGLLAAGSISSVLGGENARTEEKILAEERAARWDAVVAIRDGLETKGFPYVNKWFDSDERSASRINTVAQAAMAATMLGQDFSTEWVCADNTTITLTRDEVIGLPVAFATYAATLHEKARSLRSRITAAKTVPDVRACVWEGVEEAPVVALVA